MRDLIILGAIFFLYANGVLPLGAIGFLIGCALGLLFMYRMGYNAHTDTVKERKIAGAIKEAEGDRM